MLASLRSRLTYSGVVSTLCLFMLLGGGAYAATRITGKDVKDSSLTGRDIKNDSLTSKDVKGLTSKDFVGRLPAGLQGPKGDKGDKGDTGGVDTEILWAVVKSDATLARGKHALTSERLAFPAQPPTTGAYVVTFDRNVSQCAYSVTEGGDTPVVSAGISDPHQILAHSANGSDKVLVTAGKHDPPSPPQNVDLGFHLIVAC
jgi:hypothetical protein